MSLLDVDIVQELRAHTAELRGIAQTLRDIAACGVGMSALAALLLAERAARESAERERDTLRREHALLRAECAAGRKAQRRWHGTDCKKRIESDDCTCWIAEYTAASAATDAAGVAVTGEEGK